MERVKWFKNRVENSSRAAYPHQPVECNILAAECLNIAPAVAAKWSPNRIKNGAPNLENRRKIGSKLGPDTQKSEKTHQRNKEEGSTPQGPPNFVKNVANMASTWHPKSNQNRKKKDSKTDKNLGCFGDRFLFRFW